LPRRPVRLSAAAADSLVTECADSSPQPFNKFASLAAKRSVIHPALLLGGVAWRLRVGLQNGHHGIIANTAFIGFASCGEAHAPQSIRAQRGRANPHKMFHRQSAPKAGMWRNTLRNWQPRHSDQIAAVEIIVQKCRGTGIGFAREHQSSAVELHVVEQPSPHRGQIGNGLDVMIAPTSEEPHPPAATLLAKEKYPAGFDQGCESFLLATMFLTNCLRCRRVTHVSF